MYKTKGAPRLLRMVNNQNYATNAHHETPNPEPDHSEAQVAEGLDSDVNREPDSDSDAENSSIINEKEQTRSVTSKLRKVSGSDDKDSTSIASLDNEDKDNLLDWTRPTSTTRIRVTAKPVQSKVYTRPLPQSRVKDISTGGDVLDEDDDDAFVSASQSSQKRVRAGYGKAAASKRPKYGSQAMESDAASKDKASSRNLRKPRSQVASTKDSGKQKGRVSLARPKATRSDKKANSSQPGSSPPAGPAFRRPVGMAEFTVPTSTETSARSKHADSPPSSRSRSSSLSSLGTPKPSEPAMLRIREPTNHLTTSACPICTEQVDDTFKNDFLIEECQGGRMNLRLQQLFCKTHKERTAEKTWHDRRYPVIDWAELPRRLSKHDRRVQDVLDGKIRSHYREELDRRLRSGKTKTTVQTWKNEAESRTNVGYYGSRGEKAMTDHIVDTFGEELRRRAGSDRVIAAMGVSGGVTGYVQSVLVPEIALALIMEDSGCSEEQGRDILAESSNIGETLNAAEDERVPGGTARPIVYEIEDDDEDVEDDVTLLDD